MRWTRESHILRKTGALQNASNWKVLAPELRLTIRGLSGARQPMQELWQIIKLQLVKPRWRCSVIHQVEWTRSICRPARLPPSQSITGWIWTRAGRSGLEEGAFAFTRRRLAFARHYRSLKCLENVTGDTVLCDGYKEIMRLLRTETWKRRMRRTSSWNAWSTFTRFLAEHSMNGVFSCFAMSSQSAVDTWTDSVSIGGWTNWFYYSA